MNRQPEDSEREQIDLLRSGSVVSSLAGAFGNALRETRLTAMLGYLIALQPERFCGLFGFRGTPVSVSLEMRHAADRSDIWIETTAGFGAVEAKVCATDPFTQSQKYPAKWRVLLTEHIPTSKQRQLRGVKYFRWRDLEELLRQLAGSTNNRVRFLSRDLLSYLKEHSMMKTDKSDEIYAREINNEESLAAFLKARMYRCWYQKGSRLAEVAYFAPHFGQQIARDHPGVKVGISYIARIERVEVVDTWQNFLKIVREVRGGQWLNSHMPLLLPWHGRGHDWRKTTRSILFLSTPRLVFNPPVLKENLVKGKGFLNERYFSFDTLFAAWGC